MRIRFNRDTGCSHIRIETLTGVPLHILTRDELLDETRVGEPPLVIALKSLVKQFVAEGGTAAPTTLKVLIEAKEF